MKRFYLLAVLVLLSSSAHAGKLSFSIGGHRVHVEASKHCRSISCVSGSISGLRSSRRTHDRNDDGDRGTADPVKPAAVETTPTVTAAATPPAVYKPAAATTQAVAAPSPPPVQKAVPDLPPLPPLPAPQIEQQAEAVRPAPVAIPEISRVSREAEEDLADTPVGDWQTEGKGMVRIAKCGRALCGYMLTSSNDKGEAMLVNMKPKTDMQWAGNVYSHDSGDSYYGTIEMKGANTLRVEACAVWRFYCSGNSWTRLPGKSERLITSRQSSPEPQS